MATDVRAARPSPKPWLRFSASDASLPGRAPLPHVFIARRRPRRGVLPRAMLCDCASRACRCCLEACDGVACIVTPRRKVQRCGRRAPHSQIVYDILRWKRLIVWLLQSPRAFIASRPQHRGAAARATLSSLCVPCHIARARACLAPVLRIATMPLTAPSIHLTFPVPTWTRRAQRGMSVSVLEVPCPTWNCRALFGNAVSDIQVPDPMRCGSRALRLLT